MPDLKTEKSYYVKSIGVATTSNGKLRPKTFYLGKIEDGSRQAQLKADRIKEVWVALKALGETQWTPEALAAIEADKPAAAPVPKPSTKTSKAQMLSELGQQYLDMLVERQKKGQIGEAHVMAEKSKIERCISLAGDVPVSQFNDARLLGSILTLCARPLTAHKRRKTPPQPMSIVSAQQYLASWRGFLNWAAKTPVEGTTTTPLWVKPMQFDEHFQNNQPVMLDTERKAALEAAKGNGAVKTFAADQLVPLYQAADTNFVKYGKLFFLLAIQCGFANEEIADLKMYEIELAENPYIHRFRGKTEKPGDPGVYARWPLWSETAELLKEMIQKTGNTALLTPEGKRLIVGRSDFVRTTWDTVMERVDPAAMEKLPRLSFKYLRKTSATLIQNRLGYGQHVADAFLSHGNRGVIAKYTPQDWDKVGQAVTELRTLLQPMFSSRTAATVDK